MDAATITASPTAPPFWAPAPLSLAFTPHVRGCRVVLLLVATAIICVFDLLLTLTFLTNTGMVEANPIARSVMEHGSPLFIILWKLATMTLGLGILYWARRTRGAEIAAWLVLVIMAAVGIHWLSYSGAVVDMDVDYGLLSSADDPRWVGLMR